MYLSIKNRIYNIWLVSHLLLLSNRIFSFNKMGPRLANISIQDTTVFIIFRKCFLYDTFKEKHYEDI